MLGRQAVPITEYDTATEAVIEPGIAVAARSGKPFPDACVMVYMSDCAALLGRGGDAQELLKLNVLTTEIPLLSVRRDGYDIAVAACPIGAPVAACAMEEIHALGCRNIISLGSAGVLESAIGVGHIMLPVRAIRDEGVSYHYLPPSRYVLANPEIVEQLMRALTRNQADFARVTTWTTDAFYRETRDKAALRKAEGCSCVDMEAAALMAVAQFRNIRYGAMLYGADSLEDEVWNDRGWTKTDKRSWLMNLALSCAAHLLDEEQR